MTKLTFLSIVIFVGVGIASYFILRAQHPAVSTEKSRIDSYAIDVTYTEYNPQGLIQSKIFSKKIMQYLPKKNIIFEKPVVINYADDRTPWHIHADQGESDQALKKIILQGHVVIHELKTVSHPETTITTQALTVFPKTSFAETNDAIIISRPGITIYGKGLIANMKTGQYELKSQSKAVYKIN